MNIYYELLWISEAELDALRRKAPITGPPAYIAISSGGHIRTWPQLDPKQHRLFMQPWDSGK